MTTDNLPALRQALEAGDLKHEQILELLAMAEQQAGTMADLNRRLDLAVTWARTHDRAREKAEKALAANVSQAIRGCAKIAQRWPKEHLRDFFPRNTVRGRLLLLLGIRMAPCTRSRSSRFIAHNSEARTPVSSRHSRMARSRRPRRDLLQVSSMA